MCSIAGIGDGIGSKNRKFQCGAQGDPGGNRILRLTLFERKRNFWLIVIVSAKSPD